MSKSRRKFTDEFKTEVVGLCLAGDRSVGQVARDLGISESVVQRWVQKVKAASGATSSTGSLAAAEREELNRLRQENARLRMEREILKKAAAFFAKENA